MNNFFSLHLLYVKYYLFKWGAIYLYFLFQPDYYRDATHFRRIGAGPQYRLEIPFAKLDFTGTYTVIAKNCHGEAKAIISLQIYAKGGIYGCKN